MRKGRGRPHHAGILVFRPPRSTGRGSAPSAADANPSGPVNPFQPEKGRSRKGGRRGTAPVSFSRYGRVGSGPHSVGGTQHERHVGGPKSPLPYSIGGARRTPPSIGGGVHGAKAEFHTLAPLGGPAGGKVLGFPPRGPPGLRAYRAGWGRSATNGVFSYFEGRAVFRAAGPRRYFTVAQFRTGPGPSGEKRSIESRSRHAEKGLSGRIRGQKAGPAGGPLFPAGSLGGPDDVRPATLRQKGGGGHFNRPQFAVRRGGVFWDHRGWPFKNVGDVFPPTGGPRVARGELGPSESAKSGASRSGRDRGRSSLAKGSCCSGPGLRGTLASALFKGRGAPRDLAPPSFWRHTLPNYLRPLASVRCSPHTQKNLAASLARQQGPAISRDSSFAFCGTGMASGVWRGVLRSGPPKSPAGPRRFRPRH